MESHDLLRAISAFGLTLALIGVCAWLVQKFGRNHLLRMGKSGTSRLSVVEWRPLDGRHQLFLIKRDTVEHLLVLSPQGRPTVIERNIRPDPSSAVQPALPVGAADPLARS
jgi:flagellar protein FliO/FliZ